MREDTNLPLIIQGLGSIVNTGNATGQLTGNYSKGRGNVVWMDFIPDTDEDPTPSLITFSAGSVQIIQSITAALFKYNVGDHVHKYIALNVEGGQTYQITYDSSSNNNNSSIFCHAYFFNPYDTTDFRSKLAADRLTLQRRAYKFTGNAGRTSNASITVPTDQGNVCAIQIIHAVTAAQSSFLTVSVAVNKTTILDTVNSQLFDQECTRAGLIFPVRIPRTSEITFSINDTATTGLSLNFYLILYFDDDKLSR